MDEALLKVDRLKTYFHMASGTVRAVDGVSFALEAGKTMGIVGESGSGKSVTANSIIRLLPKGYGRIEQGSVMFNGKNIVAMSSSELRRLRGKDIAVIFQDPMTSLDPVFRVGDQMVEMILSHRNVAKGEAWRMSVNALKQVGMPEPEKRMRAYPYELSGGMCQRVIIAMAVCCMPKLLIADEPTTALDVTVQAQVLDLMREVQQKQNTAILLITHNLGVVWKMCDNVMVMYAGKSVEYADVKALYSNPLHPYTWGLLDSMPKLSDNADTPLVTIPGMPPDLRLTGACCSFYNRCKYAVDICHQQAPQFVELEPGHFVACHRQSSQCRIERSWREA